MSTAKRFFNQNYKQINDEVSQHECVKCLWISYLSDQSFCHGIKPSCCVRFLDGKKNQPSWYIP